MNLTVLGLNKIPDKIAPWRPPFLTENTLEKDKFQRTLVDWFIYMNRRRRTKMTERPAVISFLKRRLCFTISKALVMSWGKCSHISYSSWWSRLPPRYTYFWSCQVGRQTEVGLHQEFFQTEGGWSNHKFSIEGYSARLNDSSCFHLCFQACLL